MNFIYNMSMTNKIRSDVNALNQLLHVSHSDDLLLLLLSCDCCSLHVWLNSKTYSSFPQVLQGQSRPNMVYSICGQKDTNCKLHHPSSIGHKECGSLANVRQQPVYIFTENLVFSFKYYMVSSCFKSCNLYKFHINRI